MTSKRKCFSVKDAVLILQESDEESFEDDFDKESNYQPNDSESDFERRDKRPTGQENV